MHHLIIGHKHHLRLLLGVQHSHLLDRWRLLLLPPASATGPCSSMARIPSARLGLTPTAPSSSSLPGGRCPLAGRGLSHRRRLGGCSGRLWQGHSCVSNCMYNGRLYVRSDHPQLAIIGSAGKAKQIRRQTASQYILHLVELVQS
eukprot:TRINITY_DN11620_c0_g1_i3.p3 TRINITY_DN11620_c0_g1~~TRINITY_DN11620_c0_g1_i3.p3  ORF type:complete len:145 (-),score=10.91 TRINITY_DN11620_c0_g1_i3:2585-3019(-)